MSTIPAAKLPGHQWPFVGVRSAGNDMMLHGIALRGAREITVRVNLGEAMEIMRQICDEMRDLYHREPVTVVEFNDPND